MMLLNEAMLRACAQDVDVITNILSSRFVTR